MRINRTHQKAAFTVVPNTILRHPDLSLSAVGLLGRLLSMPDGTGETISSLSLKVKEGKRRVSAAFNELQEAGYFVTVRSQDPRTGLWTTEVSVFDSPRAESPSVGAPTSPEPGTRIPGLSPYGERNEEKNQGETSLPTPSVTDAQQSSATADGAEGAVLSNDNGHQEPEHDAAAVVLANLRTGDRRMILSMDDVARLAPMAAEWLRRGVSERDMRTVLLESLPGDIAAPARLLANRLQRKMPPPVAQAPAVAPLADCGECRNPLPRGQQAGICGRCAGVATSASVAAADEHDWRHTASRPGVVSPAHGRALLRGLMATS